MKKFLITSCFFLFSFVIYAQNQIDRNSILATIESPDGKSIIASINLPQEFQTDTLPNVLEPYAIIIDSVKISNLKWNPNRNSFAYIREDYQIVQHSIQNNTSNVIFETNESNLQFDWINPEILILDLDGILKYFNTKTKEVEELSLFDYDTKSYHVKTHCEVRGTIVEECEINDFGGDVSVGKYFLIKNNNKKEIDLSPLFKTYYNRMHYPENISWDKEKNSKKLIISLNWAEVYQYNLETGALSNFINTRASMLSLSPGGKYIAFWTGQSDSGVGGINIFPSNGDYNKEFYTADDALFTCWHLFVDFDW